MDATERDVAACLPNPVFFFENVFETPTILHDALARNLLAFILPDIRANRSHPNRRFATWRNGTRRSAL